VATLAEQLATWIGVAEPSLLPRATRETARRLLLDVTGLCVAARHTD
jgi:2-methylcitrate dehydratase PrpD